MVHLEYDLYFEASPSLPLQRNKSMRKNKSYHKQYKTYFFEEDQQCALFCQKTFKISRAIVRETPGMLSATEILLALTIKRLV